MSGQQVKKVVVRKKYSNGKEKVGITYEELLSIRQWVLTGSFSKEFNSDLNCIDLSKLFLIRRAAFTEPHQLNKILLDYSTTALKKETLFIILVMLSSGSFQSKKCFKDSFNKIIKTPNDMYRLFSILRKHRGLGSVVHTTVKKWFSNHDIHELERMFVSDRAKYNWSSKDVIRLIKPKPRNKQENLIFKWITTGGISDSNLLDYKTHCPLIYLYEQLRTGEPNNGMFSFAIEHDFTQSMVPGNAIRPEFFKEWLLENKSTEDLLYYYKNNSLDPSVKKIVNKKLLNLEESKGTLNMSLVEMISVVEVMIDSFESNSSLSIMDDLISDKIKKTANHDEHSVHVIDMSPTMFNKLLPPLKIPPSAIATLSASKSKNIISFTGNKRTDYSERSLIGAEGVQGASTRINIDKVSDCVTSKTKTIFIWTNTTYTKSIERDMMILKTIHKDINICFMNMGKSKLTEKDYDYYVIDGFNKDTKKLIRLVERGMNI